MVYISTDIYLAYSRSAISYALRNNKYEAFEYLLSVGASPYLKMQWYLGQKTISCFNLAAASKNSQLVEILKRYHDINSLNENGETLVEEVLFSGCVMWKENLEFLMEHGLDLYQLDFNGNNAVSVCYKYPTDLFFAEKLDFLKSHNVKGKPVIRNIAHFDKVFDSEDQQNFEKISHFIEDGFFNLLDSNDRAFIRLCLTRCFIGSIKDEKKMYRLSEFKKLIPL